MRSITATEPKAKEISAVLQSAAKISSRASAVRIFESAMPFGIRFGSSTTAAATTGPASGPRPASSTPATRRKPSRKSLRSVRKFGGFAVATRAGGT